MVESNQDFDRKLAELRLRFSEGLAARLQEMETAFAGLAGNGAADGRLASLKALRAVAHKLTGTAGTFGFDAIGKAAAEIETQCDDLIAAGKLPADDELQALERRLDMLRKGSA